MADVELDTFAPTLPVELTPQSVLPKKNDLLLEFDFTPDVEHATLLCAVFGSMALMLLSFTTVIHWAVGATLALALVGGCLGVFRSRYREARKEAVRMLRVAERELSELLAETRDVRGTFQRAANSLEHDRMHVMNSLEMRLRKTESTLSAETQALGTQKAEAADAIVRQREEIDCQFDGELCRIRDGFQKTIAVLNRELSSIGAELTPAAPSIIEENDVFQELRKHHISTADEHYFGPALKDLLISEGVTTAADIALAIVTMPEIGPLRGSAALSWKRAVESQIRTKLTRQSYLANGKKGELERQREGIEATRQACEAELVRLEADVAMRRVAELDRLHHAALAQAAAFEAEIARVKSDNETIMKRIRRRLAELGNLPEPAIWNARISSLDARIRRIETQLNFVQDQLIHCRNHLTFWRYLRSL